MARVVIAVPISVPAYHAPIQEVHAVVVGHVVQANPAVLMGIVALEGLVAAKADAVSKGQTRI